jgi:lipopolysaccharide transport system ATP-binding protein
MMPTDVATRRRLDLQGVGYVDFSIPELPLSAGDYVLEFFVDSSGVAQDELAAARSLSVVDGDFYGSGRDYPVGWAGKYVLVKFGWERGPEKHIVGSAPELKA